MKRSWQDWVVIVFAILAIVLMALWLWTGNQALQGFGSLVSAVVLLYVVVKEHRRRKQAK